MGVVRRADETAGRLDVYVVPAPCDAAQRVRVLAILSHVDDELIRDVVAASEWLRVPAGVSLFCVGDPPDGMYGLVSGRMRFFVDEDGRAVLTAEASAGVTFGEGSLLIGGGRSRTAVVVRDAETRPSPAGSIPAPHGHLAHAGHEHRRFGRRAIRLSGRRGGPRRDQLDHGRRGVEQRSHRRLHRPVPEGRWRRCRGHRPSRSCVARLGRPVGSPAGRSVRSPPSPRPRPTPRVAWGPRSPGRSAGGAGPRSPRAGATIRDGGVATGLPVHRSPPCRTSRGEPMSSDSSATFAVMPSVWCSVAEEPAAWPTSAC